MVFALSSTFMRRVAGQFMVCNLWLAGVPAASIVASVAAISSRFALYSASIAPHLRGASKRQTLAVAATLTEEADGISLAKLVEGEDWGPHESTLRSTRSSSRHGGVFVYDGRAIMRRRRYCLMFQPLLWVFVCTSTLYLPTLFSQRLSRGNVVAAVMAAVSVALLARFLGVGRISPCRQARLVGVAAVVPRAMLSP
ncbi:MAG: AzlC family ABC transporter permease [Collinsella sp.]